MFKTSITIFKKHASRNIRILMNKQSALIIEDSSIVALSLEGYLINLNYTVCGIATNYHEAITCFKQCCPQLVLCDIHLHGDRNGIDFAKTICKDYPMTQVIFISSDNCDGTLRQAQGTRPDAFLTKPFTKEQLVAAIKMSQFKTLHEQPEKYQITQRELEVLSLLSEGLAHKEIAERLCISPHTVDSRRRKIMEKLEVNSTNQALHLASSNGWI